MSKLTETKKLIKSGKASAGVIFPKHWLQIMELNDIKVDTVNMVLNVERKTITITKAE